MIISRLVMFLIEFMWVIVSTIIEANICVCIVKRCDND